MSAGTHVLTAEEQGCLERCRDYAQYYKMRKEFESRVCVFCNVDRKLNEVLVDDNPDWLLWDNPFKEGKYCDPMLVIPARRHIRHLSEVTQAAWISLGKIVHWAEVQYGLQGGMLFARFGDMNLNAGTVPHLHFNLYVPDGKGEVRVPIAKKPEDQIMNRQRALGFSHMYTLGETP